MLDQQITSLVSDNNLHSSELIRKPIPNTSSESRLSYYTDLYFNIDDINVGIVAKVDTGASYTIIGTEVDGLDACVDYINANAIIEKEQPEDATKNKIHMKSLTVSDFQLTKEICIPKIKLFFSDDLKDKAILGMDILSLYDFVYRHEVNQIKGTFWLIHNPYATTKMEKQIKDDGHVVPRTIMNVDNGQNVQTRVLYRSSQSYYIEVNKKKIGIPQQAIMQDTNGTYFTVLKGKRYNLDMKYIL